LTSCSLSLMKMISGTSTRTYSTYSTLVFLRRRRHLVFYPLGVIDTKHVPCLTTRTATQQKRPMASMATSGRGRGTTPPTAGSPTAPKPGTGPAPLSPAAPSGTAAVRAPPLAGSGYPGVTAVPYGMSYAGAVAPGMVVRWKLGKLVGSPTGLIFPSQQIGPVCWLRAWHPRYDADGLPRCACPHALRLRSCAVGRINAAGVPHEHRCGHTFILILRPFASLLSVCYAY